MTPELIEHTLQAERVVLGLTMGWRGDYADATIQAGGDDWWFTHPDHAAIWRAVVAARKDGRQPDAIEISARVGRDGGDSLLKTVVAIREAAPPSQNEEAWLRELATLAWTRRAVGALATLQAQLQCRPPFAADGAELVTSTLASILSTAEVGEPAEVAVPAVASKLVDLIEERVKAFQDGRPRGVTTGMPILDRVFGGWMPGRFYVLAARPSVGKTTLAVNFAATADFAQIPWAFYTLEMSAEDIIEKALSLRSKVKGYHLQSGDLNDEEFDRLSHGISHLSRSVGVVDNKSGRFVESFEPSVRRLVKKRGVKVVFLDYLQQMRVRSERFSSRQAELTLITDRLKQIAMDTGVAIVACAQLSREAEKADAPLMSHLKESGSIEQDADAILFIHRDKNDPLAETEIIVAKNRHGPKGSLVADMDLAINKFTQSERQKNEEAR